MRRYLRGRIARWIRQRQGADTLPVRLARRRLYILPTRAGLGFAALLLFMLVAGLNYGNSAALFLTFLLTGFALVAMHRCHRNLLGVALLGAAAPSTFAGDGGCLQLRFENPTRLPRVRLGAQLDDMDGMDAVDGMPMAPEVSFDLEAGSQQEVILPLAARRRGLVRIDRVRIVTRHPFGLFRTWTWIHTPVEMIVYPRARGERPRPITAGSGMRARSAALLGADEWLGLRPFRHGDSPRQVDWRAYARGAPLLVKEYGASESDWRLFEFDSLSGLSIEARLEQLARWIVDAESSGERYGLVLPARSPIRPDHGAAHRHRCLTALALHEWTDSAADLAAVDSAAAHRTQRLRVPTGAKP